MIPIKNKKEIEIMKEGGRRVREVLAALKGRIAEGVKTIDLEKQALRLIENAGGKPSFKMVPGYGFATCITLNEEVVHGIPSDKKIKAGDLVSLDLGIYYQGFHTDAAFTIQVPGGNQRSYFLKTGQKTLAKAISQAKSGSYVGHISKTIEEEISKAGFFPVRELTGHGVGRKLHEQPAIPCFLKGEPEKTPELAPGMTLAIEVIYTDRKTELALASDGWTMKAKNAKISGLFERTIAVTQKDPLVLT